MRLSTRVESEGGVSGPLHDEGVDNLPVIIDSRLRLPSSLPRPVVDELRAEFHHSNPDFHKKDRMGRSTYNVPRHIDTWRMEPHPEDGLPALTLPRGGTKRLRLVLTRNGYRARFIDKRVRLPEVEWPQLRDIELRYYQNDSLELCIVTEQGLVRAPTGGGKTVLALAAAAALKQPTLVIMRDSNLMKQWLAEAQERLGMSPKEIGILKGGRKLKVGKRLTLALQQTLSSASFPLAELDPLIGAVIVDEVQLVASRTFQRVVDGLSARYRLGVTADETRKDRMEFITYDVFGEVLYTITREQLEEDGFVVPVRVRLVPTDFPGAWYRDASAADKDFGQLIDQMAVDERREALLVDLVKKVVGRKETPLFVFSQRTEHASQLADKRLFHAGVQCGLMIGGDSNARRFDEDKRQLLEGALPVAAGTYQALGVGLNVPGVRAGVMALPIGNNPQFFNQVRGRVCRASKGKEEGILYVLWDRYAFPYMPRTIAGWNRGNTEVLQEDGTWGHVHP